jgi:hypothetical protein
MIDCHGIMEHNKLCAASVGCMQGVFSVTRLSEVQGITVAAGGRDRSTYYCLLLRTVPPIGAATVTGVVGNATAGTAAAGTRVGTADDAVAAGCCAVVVGFVGEAAAVEAAAAAAATGALDVAATAAEGAVGTACGGVVAAVAAAETVVVDACAAGVFGVAVVCTATGAALGAVAASAATGAALVSEDCPATGVLGPAAAGFGCSFTKDSVPFAACCCTLGGFCRPAAWLTTPARRELVLCMLSLLAGTGRIEAPAGLMSAHAAENTYIYHECSLRRGRVQLTAAQRCHRQLGGRKERKNTGAHPILLGPPPRLPPLIFAQKILA